MREDDDVCLKCDERRDFSQKTEENEYDIVPSLELRSWEQHLNRLNLPHFNVGSSHIMLCAVVVLTKYRLDGVLISKIDHFMYIIPYLRIRSNQKQKHIRLAT